MPRLINAVVVLFMLRRQFSFQRGFNMAEPRWQPGDGRKGANLEQLALAREARRHPPSNNTIRSMAARWETARLADLLVDERLNPELYCARVAAVPTDGVCTHCKVSAGITHKVDHHGEYLYCLYCGTDYFPDAEPVPALGHKGGGGRHSEGDELIGEHHLQSDKINRERKRNNATT